MSSSSLDLSVPNRILKHVKETAKKDNVSSVIDAIDHYCYNSERAMNVGDVKGRILDSILKESDANSVLEFGTFCGYSSLRIARILKEHAQFFTIELDKGVAAIAREIHKFADMDARITILQGKSSNVLHSLSTNHGIKSFDFVFFDHQKSFYKVDLILLEELKLLHAGTVIVADNCTHPGCPDYLEYVRNNPKYESTNYLSKLEYSEKADSMEKSVYLG